MPVDPGTDVRFTTLFSADECAFLKRLFPEHPGIEQNFVRFLEMPARGRPEAAVAAIKRMPRKGWVIRGLKEQESVYEHITELSVLLERSLPFLLKDAGYSPQRAEELAEHILAMAKVHDVHEAIATDFTPTCNIAEDDKHALERLAAKVVFETSPERYALAEEYIKQQTPASHLLNDFDKIHAVAKAAAMEVRNPQYGGSGLFESFLSHARTKMKTEIGRRYLEDIALERQETGKLRETLRVDKPAERG